ncbi:MAG: hypothetical protein ABSE04_02075 [Candidatus Microgenomates bacterium]|jgi:hypothetical protein
MAEHHRHSPAPKEQMSMDEYLEQQRGGQTPAGQGEKKTVTLASDTVSVGGLVPVEKKEEKEAKTESDFQSNIDRRRQRDDEFLRNGSGST